MQSTTRRAFLLRTAAATASLIAGQLPQIPASVEAAPAAPPLKAFVVGTDGEYNWIHVKCASIEEAKKEFLWANCGSHICEEVEEGKCAEPPEDCDCEVCQAAGDLEVTRIKKWDTMSRDAEPADWLRAGLGACCEDCNEETSFDMGAHILMRPNKGRPSCSRNTHDPTGEREMVFCEECWEKTPEFDAECRAEEAEMEAEEAGAWMCVGKAPEETKS